jgi:hypothetical protein
VRRLWKETWKGMHMSHLSSWAQASCLYTAEGGAGVPWACRPPAACSPPPSPLPLHSLFAASTISSSGKTPSTAYTSSWLLLQTPAASLLRPHLLPLLPLLTTCTLGLPGKVCPPSLSVPTPCNSRHPARAHIRAATSAHGSAHAACSTAPGACAALSQCARH